MIKVNKDLTGLYFGRLKVLEQTEDYVEPSGRHRDRWLCECSCEEHTKIVVTGAHLTSSHTRSCGCLRKETTTQTNKSRGDNTYELNLIDEHGTYGMGYCSNTGTPFYFDMDDYDKIKDFCWHEAINNKTNFHTISCTYFETNQPITMHQLLGYKWHDHIDRNELNNRKYNLRPCTPSQNAMNRNIQSNNTSGIIGVSWDKSREKWRAYIKIDGKYKAIGRFNTKEEAIRARLQAEAQYFGEFSPQKHLYKEYNINS